MSSQSYADTLALILMVSTVALGYSGASWAYTPMVAMFGVLSIKAFNRRVSDQILPIGHLGPISMYLLQLLNALGLFGIGRIISWILS